MEDLDEDAVEACTVAAVAVPRRAINSRATAHAVTLAVAVITEIAIMAIGVAVLSLVVVDTIRAPEARHIAVVGKATHIPTFPVVGDTMVAVGVLVPERVLWAASASACSGDNVGQVDSLPTKEESADLPTSSDKAREDPDPTPVKGEPTSDLKATPTAPEGHAVPQETPSLPKMPAPAVVPPPPSRMRIYFNSPATPDDSRLIPGGASFSIVGSDEASSRRGKRKKSEDDDGDQEEGRAPPPPPGGSRPERSKSIDRFERASTTASAAPSVAETASEGDWLMAAIGEDEGDGEDGGGEPQLSGNDLNGKDGSTYVAESEYGEFGSSPSIFGVCVGVGSGPLGSLFVPRACEHGRPGGVCVQPYH